MKKVYTEPKVDVVLLNLKNALLIAVSGEMNEGEGDARYNNDADWDE